MQMKSADEAGLEAIFAHFWGKSREPAEYPYHPVAYHCLDVGACVAELLDRNPALLRLLATAFGTGIPDAVRRTVVLLAILHDLGKFARSFQALSPQLCEMLGMPHAYAGTYSRKMGTAHDALGLWLWEEERLAELLFGVFDPGVDWFIATGAFGHHGAPVDIMALREDIGPRFPAANRRAALAFAEAARALLPGSLAVPVDEASAKRASFLIAAMVNVGDWLGSDATAFPYSAPSLPVKDYWTVATSRAWSAVEAAGLVSAAAAARCGFGVLFPGTEPTPLQAAANNVPLPRQFLAILEDTMGSGKTEAGLTMASRAIAYGSSRGLFCGLPTTATTDAQADRQRRYYRLLFGADAAPSMTTAHSLTRPGTALQDGVSCAEWISDDRRRRMLADVCVGTVDQALLAALPARFAAVRLFGLAGKLLVLDEVHSYDAYTSTLIASLLKLHAALGGSAVLLSATLRAETKLALARAFCQGAVFAEPALSEISNPAYPLVTMIGPEGVAFEAPPKAWRAPRDKRVRLIHSEAEAREAILACVRAGGCAAWIRNTVDATVAAGRALADQHGDVTIFHARFPEADRERIQARVLGRFGKEAAAVGRHGGIVVATAIIEQSLDLDFDLVVIDLKPMDALAQALGRALRHLRDEDGKLLPEAKGAIDRRPPREMLVLSPDPEAVIDGRWYGRLLDTARFVHRDPAVLWRTARILAREGVVSYGNLRKLIEETYDEEVAAPACFKDQSEHAYGEDLGKRSTAFGLARGFSPDLGYDRQDGFWDDLKVPTRDGDAIEAVLVRIVGNAAVPYEGTIWASGRMRLPLSRVRRMSNDIADPRLSEAIKLCKFTLLVPMEAQDAALMHDGTVIDPCLCIPDRGLSWTN